MGAGWKVKEALTSRNFLQKKCTKNTEVVYFTMEKKRRTSDGKRRKSKDLHEYSSKFFRAIAPPPPTLNRHVTPMLERRQGICVHE